MLRYILTGAAGVGKTAILRQLELNGHMVVEEAATDVIALENALGNDQPHQEPSFIDKIVMLQRRRQVRAQAVAGATTIYDRSPVCTLALSYHLGFAPSHPLTDEVRRIITEGVYEPTVFFIRNQGFMRPTPARRMSFDDSLVFERLHEQTYRDLGFRLAEVPAGVLSDRVALVQRTIECLRA